MSAAPSDLYRELPSVESLRLDPNLSAWSEQIRPEFLVAVIREVLDRARRAIEKSSAKPDRDKLIEQIKHRLQELSGPTLHRVINATGVVLHTGLGRAPLAPVSINALLNAARYCNVELELNTGERGNRQDHVSRLLSVLTGAEAAMIVNNNAAALYLVLNALAFGREVIVARGQLIEIGGSFRLPEIMRRAGAKLVEVGTTNRTRIDDYRSAISAKTALLLRAYPSNYRIEGFSESASIRELVELGNEHGIPVVDDLGGGLLWDWTPLGLPYEPTVRESLEAGADIVLVSGDKALGGPQSGIVLGSRKLVGTLQRAPLARVLRPDKLILASLSATLRLYLHPRGPQNAVPAWQMLSETVDSVSHRASTLCEHMKSLTSWNVLEVRRCESQTGSGTLPAVGIESRAVVCLPLGETASRWARRLRTANIPVMTTTNEELVWFDLRTIAESETNDLLASITETLKR